MIDLRTLTDGGQTAESVARLVADFIEPARSTIELALYDVVLGDVSRGVLEDAFARARDRGVRIRLAFNRDRPVGVDVPPPGSAEVAWAADFAEIRPIAGVPSLMHQKYVIRDGEAVWTGSTNWRDDAWTREENVIAIVSSAAVAASFERDFAQLWEHG